MQRSSLCRLKISNVTLYLSLFSGYVPATGEDPSRQMLTIVVGIAQREIVLWCSE